MSQRIPLAIFLVALPLFAGLLLLNQPRPALAGQWQQKVDPWVLETAVDGDTEFLLFLTEQADLSFAATLTTKEEKGRYVAETLQAAAARSQAPLLVQLKEQGLEHRSFWIANMVWVRGDMAAVRLLAGRADVAHIYANPTVQVEAAPPTAAPFSPAAIEWGVLKIQAPDVWAAGFTGQGIVIGGQDTGYDWDHPGLINQYRGWDGGSADHNYHWHDAITSGSGGVCGLNSPEPCDDFGHGTHTMGTMVGDDGGANQVGVAPGARWIGCRNMDQGNGTPATYSACYQWFIAPTDLNNQNPDPAQAPHVINNSWSCPPSEGCTDPNVLLTVTENVRAAGIVTVHSAGNGGSGCGSVSTPSAIYDASFSVGATNSGDNIAGFSSRGPVTVDGSNRLKPDVSAPGVNVRSTTPGGNYGSSSGTSMAGPHVAGLIALLLSAEPALSGDVDAIEALIAVTAVPRTTTQNCGAIPGSEVPNHTYGYGRVDALNAFNALDQHQLALVKNGPALAQTGEEITYTLAFTHAHPFSATHNVVLSDTIPLNTTFVTGTLPHTFDGSVITWHVGTVDNTSLSFELVVRVDALPPATITNKAYGLRSDDVPLVTGPAVDTLVVGQRTLLPFVTRD